MLEQFINFLLDEGWLFNNCYQNDAGIWRVNLRRPSGNGDYFTGWAESPSFLGALQACASKIEDATFHEEKKAVFSVTETQPKKADLNTLLADIGF